MLVVIAIIGILASMMSPLLRKAYDESVAIACMNNQKNLALTIIQFDQDYRRTPPSFKGGSKTGAEFLRWVDLVGDWFDQYTPWQSFLAVYMYPDFFTTNKAYQKAYRYDGICHIFTCPALGGEWALNLSVGTSGVPEQHYALNNNLRAKVWHKSLSRVRSPSKRLLLGEPELNPADSQRTLLGYASSVPIDTSRPGEAPLRHNPNTTPISYADGHVKRILGIEVPSSDTAYSTAVKKPADLEKYYFWGKGYPY